MTRHERALLSFLDKCTLPDNTISKGCVEQALALFPTQKERVSPRVVAIRRPNGSQFWFHCLPTVTDGGVIETTSRFDTIDPHAMEDLMPTQSEIAEIRDTIKRQSLTLSDVKESGLQFDWKINTPPHFSSQVHVPRSDHFFYFIIFVATKEA